MRETLEQTKTRVRQSFLGKPGIHAVGLSRQDQALKVYIDSDFNESPDVIAAICESSKPFRVIVIREQPPSLAL